MQNLFILLEEDFNPIHIEESLPSMYKHIKCIDVVGNHIVDEHTREGSIARISVSQLMCIEEESIPNTLLNFKITIDGTI